MSDNLSPFQAFISAFSVSSLAGLAAYLRSSRQLTVRGTISAMLNSGLLGLAIVFCWYTYFNDRNNIWFMLGVSLLAGLGGISVLDFILQVVKRGGLDIHISTQESDDTGDTNSSRGAKDDERPRT